MFCYVMENGKTVAKQLSVRLPSFEQGDAIAAALESNSAESIAEAIGLVANEAKMDRYSAVTKAAKFSKDANQLLFDLTAALLDNEENREAVGAKDAESFKAAIRKGCGPAHVILFFADLKKDPVVAGELWAFLKDMSLIKRLSEIGAQAASREAVDLAIVDDEPMPAPPAEDIEPGTDSAAAPEGAGQAEPAVE